MMMKVGVFSRDSPDNFRWLLDFLYTFLPQNNVRYATITNHSTLSITGVSFAILYHSKSRGRINVTDVTDSLYDKELEELSRTLGREKVLVVIDDLEDVSDQVRRTILENQPSISTLASELLLFSVQEKQDGKTHPTNQANRSAIRKRITGRPPVSPIPHASPVSSAPPVSCPCYQVISPWRKTLILTAAVLLLYMFALYWYNCRVLLW
ncbi:uncharacterized protein [Dendropsophus ebraccatus]|uniref:uncharacterized protein n=1 Tax=Dendropsophus ebraccatus TaxID=150705 RepID=UPI00383168A6